MFFTCPYLYICILVFWIHLYSVCIVICIYLYVYVLLSVLSVICTKGLRATQFQFSVCMCCTCGRIDNKADFMFVCMFLSPLLNMMLILSSQSFSLVFIWSSLTLFIILSKDIQQFISPLSSWSHSAQQICVWIQLACSFVATGKK